MTPEEFASYMRSNPTSPEAEHDPMREAYRYAKVGFSRIILLRGFNARK